MDERVSAAVLCVLLWSGGAWGAEGRHECERVCDGTARRCRYEFAVGLSRRENPTPKVFLAVNGASPGPPISVCENDTILVDVKNNLPSGLETSLHWHGFSEGNSPFMDGVPFITQCPISPRTTFRYHLTARRPGTFYYRAHSVAQQLDGVYGPLVVRERDDRTAPEEVVVVVSAEMQSLQSLERSYEQDLKVEGLRMGVYRLGGVREGEGAHRVRVINAAGLDCPLTLFTHIVPLRVAAVDGNQVEPVGVNEIIVSPGERVDLLLKPEVMRATHVIGHHLCEGHAVYGLDPSVGDRSEVVGRGRGLDFGGMLRGLKSAGGERLPRGDVRVFLSFDASVFKGFKGAVDFRYKLGALTPFAPSVLVEKEVSLLQFHNKSFLYPPSPLLSQPKDLQDLLCQPDEISERCRAYSNGFCECLQTVELPFNYNVDLFIVDEGRNGNVSQTVHIHGHSFHVLAVESFDRPITAVELWEREVLGKVKRNLVGPVKKDTIVVPNKGFVCLRLRPTNPGKWLLESTTSKAKTGYGLEVVLNVENPAEEPAPPEGFPTCGNMKEPDMVFTDD